MIHLTKEERIVLIFLIVSLLTGVGVKALRKQSHPLLSQYFFVNKDAIHGKTAEHTARRRHAPHTVNINRASIQELTALKGIGAVLAERIVTHRQIHGPFVAKDELKKVKGVGEKIFEKIRDGISLE